MSQRAISDIVAAVATAAASQQCLDLMKYLRRFAKRGSSKMYYAETTLAASASVSLDLAGGVTDTDGATTTFTKIRAIVIHALAGNTNDVQVGGAASNQFINWVANSSDIVNIKPGALFLLTCPTSAGFAITAGTGDILKIANSAGSTGVTFQIIIIGDVA